jgi:hypothetical protein
LPVLVKKVEILLRFKKVCSGLPETDLLSGYLFCAKIKGVIESRRMKERNKFFI